MIRDNNEISTESSYSVGGVKESIEGNGKSEEGGPRAGTVRKDLGSEDRGEFFVQTQYTEDEKEKSVTPRRSLGPEPVRQVFTKRSATEPPGFVKCNKTGKKCWPCSKSIMPNSKTHFLRLC